MLGSLGLAGAGVDGWISAGLLGLAEAVEAGGAGWGLAGLAGAGRGW